VHRSNAASWFPAFAQFEGTEESSASITEWSNQLRSWHMEQQEQDPGEAKSTSRKTNSRYKKRPVVAENRLPLQRVGLYATSSSSRPTKRQAVLSSVRGSESDESALQFQWMQQGGHEQQAALACLAEWTRGRACRTIRRRRQQTDSPTHMEEDEVKALTSWRDTILDSTVAISGDYRDETAKTLNEHSTAIYLSNEELQATWMAVLACAEACLEQVKSKEQQMYLSAVSDFLQHAAQLPLPVTVVAAQEIAVTMGGLAEAYTVARRQQAQLLDLWGEDGVDVDVIRKQIETAETTVGLVLDEMDEIKRQVDVVSAWQGRVDAVYGQCNTMDEASDRNDLLSLELLLLEGRMHGFRCKGLTALEQKVERAYSLQDRILNWKVSSQENRETMKFIAAVVRDIHRLKIRFPVVNEMLVFHQEAESWIERANIAIRSRISLDEIKTLIERGLDMPLDLREYLDKLQSRVAMATEWLDSFEEVISCPQTENGIDKLELIRRIRAELDEHSGHSSVLYELATASGRIPVEIDCVKLLHVELDARAWSSKAKKWIPEGELDEGGRRGKLEDLREHVAKASALRDRLALSSSEVKAWVLDGESELSSIVNAADDWLDAYQSILDGDNEDAYTIEQLRKIVQEANSIYANIGNGVSKFQKILAQAESWYKKYYPLFVRCNIRGIAPSNSLVQIHELKTAVSAASSDVSLPLEEGRELKALGEKIENWFYRASLACGQKRQTKGKKLVFTVDDLIALIDEAETLPVDTKAEVALLQRQCQLVKEWQLRASNDLEGILVGFRYLREAINETYGPASMYKRDRSSEIQAERKCGADDPSSENNSETCVVALHDRMNCDNENKSTDETSSQCDATVSTATSDQDMNALANLGNGECTVHLLIKSFCNDSKTTCILTPETEMASLLSKVSRWCLRSLTYIENQQDIFDKRFFGAFDRFMAEGNALLKFSETNGGLTQAEGDSSMGDRLRSEWTMIVSDQLERLAVLLADRKEYVTWCNKAEQVLNTEERRPTLDKLNELAVKSREFPAGSDLIQKVRTVASQAIAWSQAARQALSSAEKISIHDARTLFAKGDELGFTCDEMKMLRNGLKAARSWSNRVKRCKVDQGAAHHSHVHSLIEEHKSLIVDMTDEATKLQHAIKNYCLCRRPYEGFMIGCDECEDWFHGPCIGVSESRADRVSKYVCIRCSITKTYKASSLAIVDVIRKWISKKDLKRVRQVENQKHKRKVRKENKDIEKMQAEGVALRQQLDRCNRGEAGGKAMHGEEDARIDACAPESDDDKNSGCELPRTELINRCTLDGTDSIDIADVARMVSSGDVSVVHAPEPAGIEKLSGDSAGNISDANRDAADSVGEESVSVDKAVEAPLLTRDEILAKLNKIAVSVQGCVSRLAQLSESAAEQKCLEDTEDKLSAQLRNWVLRVRSLVLVPSTVELATLSRPKLDGALSDAMLSVAEDAKRLGLQEIRDVNAVLNSFKCIAWCLRAMSILARQPSSTEIVDLVDQASSIELPDEKSIRVIKSMTQRVAAWENKVSKALIPIPGEGKPFNLDSLKELATTGDDIPVCMPLEQRLATVIDDGGCRHCLCGGPSDGRFMVGCDICDRWFHGHCVLVDKDTPENDLTDWICPPCAGSSTESTALNLCSFHDKYDVCADDSDSEEGQDISSKAPDPDRLWPPFGLFGSTEAREVLGEECCAIPECVDPLPAAAEPRIAATSFGSHASSSNGFTGNMVTVTVGDRPNNLALFLAAVGSSETYSTQTTTTNAPSTGMHIDTAPPLSAGAAASVLLGVASSSLQTEADVSDSSRFQVSTSVLSPPATTHK
jgi:PLU-1-like protein/PHD-finger